eukprot:g16925.t1
MEVEDLEGLSSDSEKSEDMLPDSQQPTANQENQQKPLRQRMLDWAERSKSPVFKELVSDLRILSRSFVTDLEYKAKVRFVLSRKYLSHEMKCTVSPLEETMVDADVETERTLFSLSSASGGGIKMQLDADLAREIFTVGSAGVGGTTTTSAQQILMAEFLGFVCCPPGAGGLEGGVEGDVGVDVGETGGATEMSWKKLHAFYDEAASEFVKRPTGADLDHAGENYDLPAPASVVLVEELQRTSGQHSVLDQSKCSNENEDCCAHPNWGGEEQTCKEGYLPIPDPAPLTWCSSKRSDCATHRDNGIGCYGCYAPFRVKDQSRCSDQPDQSCCAHPSWGVPQTCSDGYEPVADPSPSTHCSSTSSSCASRDNGIGCYKCVTPFLGLMDQSKCNDNLGQDCCGHPSIGNQYQACDVGYLPVADPDPISWCSSKWSDCATATDVAHTPEIRCYGCYATTSSTTPAPEPTPAPGEGSSSFGIAALAIGGVLLLIGSIWLGKELTEKPEVPEDAVVT